jgi:hypothetical protein
LGYLRSYRNLPIAKQLAPFDLEADRLESYRWFESNPALDAGSPLGEGTFSDTNLPLRLARLTGRVRALHGEPLRFDD